MAQYLNAGTVAASSSLYSWLQVADEERSDLHNPRFNWSYNLRAKENAGMPSLWQELWTSPKLAMGDSTSPGLLGQDPAEAGRFEYPSTISRGMTRPWMFRGFCKDENGNPLGGAVVEAYLQAGDTPVGRCACDDRGYYECPTPYSGMNHYLVARYASGNRAGSTIDTLQPSI